MRRTQRVAALVTREEKAQIARRAAAHRVSVAEYLRAVALGQRPAKRGVGADADDWWETLPPSRRAQVHGWLTRPGTTDQQIPGQEVLALH